MNDFYTEIVSMYYRVQMIKKHTMLGLVTSDGRKEGGFF